MVSRVYVGDLSLYGIYSGATHSSRIFHHGCLIDITRSDMVGRAEVGGVFIFLLSFSNLVLFSQ